MAEKTTKEKIQIQDYRSSKELKAEIRNRILSRQASNWILSGIETKKSVILITFSER